MGDSGLIPGLGRYPGEGNGNPLQYSCLKNPMDRGALQVHGVPKSQTRLKDEAQHSINTVRASLVAQMVKNLPTMQETGV